MFYGVVNRNSCDFNDAMTRTENMFFPHVSYSTSVFHDFQDVR